MEQIRDVVNGTQWDKVVKIASAVAGGIASAFGGFDVMLRVLVVCMVVDYLTGWMVALMGKSTKTESGFLDSNIGFKGICKKCMILAMVLMATYLDKAIGGEAFFRSIVIWFYVANEALSVVENLALAGVPFPESVKRALEQIKKKNNEGPTPPESDNHNFPEDEEFS